MNSDSRSAEFKLELHREFLSAIHKEKISTQCERANYVKSKLIFVSALFGLGSLKIGSSDSYMLLYLVPVIAFGYDLYIQAADTSIKKIGAFLRYHLEAGTVVSEKAWEKYSANNRDKYARLANTLFSVLLSIIAGIYLYHMIESKNYIEKKLTFYWFLFSVLLIVWQGIYQNCLINMIDKNKKGIFNK